MSESTGSGPVDPQGTPGGGSPPGTHFPTLPPELQGSWPDPVHPQAARMPEIREARSKLAYVRESTYGVVPGGKDFEACKARFDNVAPFGGIIDRLTSAPIVDPGVAAPVESIGITPIGVRATVFCPECKGLCDVLVGNADLRARTGGFRFTGRRGRLMDIEVQGRCCSKRWHASFPVWIEDDWIGA